MLNKNQTGQSGQRLDVDSILSQLLESKVSSINITESDIKEITNTCRYILVEQPLLLELQAPVKIVGNIHGQYSDLINIFRMSGTPGNTNYLFLGNYVDRGTMSLQTILLLLCYKIKFPQNIFLLRGNHEIASTNRFFGFYDECKRKINVKIWKIFNQLFNYLPLCAVIERKIFCVHGGLSPELQSLNQINKFSRPLEITNQNIPIDLLWSDPQASLSGWHQNERGISYVYGMEIVFNFLRENNFQLIVRSHQVVQMGYQFMFNKTLVTIFSAPNFLGEYNNFGAVMVVQQNLKCSFELLKPKHPNKSIISVNHKRMKE